MALLRLVLLLVLAYVVFAALRAATKRARRSVPRRDGNPAAEDMVLDPQCHSYIAKADAVTRWGRYFCSQECAQLYLSR